MRLALCAAILWSVCLLASAADAEIPWFSGTVDDAFAEAAQAGKPVFLYWGAQWCPPCSQLKATVFRRPAFIEQTRNFVAVYLDGDQAGAQKWGEYFGVVGYPTLIVFRADRTELTRIAGGLDLEQYPRVLEAARRQTQPAGELLARAQSQPQALGDDDWLLLASYGWEVDEGRVLPPAAAASVFAVLAERAPRADLRQRFALLSLVERVNARASIAPADAARDRQQLLALLADAPAVRANFTQIAGYGAAVIGAISAPASPERAALGQAFYAAMDRAFDDARYSVSERLDAVYAQYDLFRVDHPAGAVPKALAQTFHERALWADKAATTPAERQAVINEVALLLEGAGFAAEAEAVLRAEVERSPQPYYFMVKLAERATKRNDIVAALDWYRRAWESAKGTATRTQWGVYYVHGLIELTPADAKTIEATLSKMIAEIAADPGAFYQRTRHKLDEFAPALARWSAAHHGAPVIKRLRERMAGVCAGLPPDSDARRSCEAFPPAA